MKKIWLLSLMLIPVFILGGCGNFLTSFSRPNTTDAERDKDFYACWHVAKSEYGDDIVKKNVTTTNCTTKKDGQQACTSETNVIEDNRNFSRQKGVVERCMKSKGY